MQSGTERGARDAHDEALAAEAQAVDGGPDARLGPEEESEYASASAASTQKVFGLVGGTDLDAGALEGDLEVEPAGGLLNGGGSCEVVHAALDQDRLDRGHERLGKVEARLGDAGGRDGGRSAAAALGREGERRTDSVMTMGVAPAA